MLSFSEYMNEAKETFLTVFEEDPDGWSVFRMSQFSGGGSKRAEGGFRSRAIATKKAHAIAKKTGERVSKPSKGMRERVEFRLGRARPKTSNSWGEVDGLASDFWVVDRVFPRRDEADRIAGPYKKMRHALRKAREIVRETGEKLFVDPDGPDGPLPAKEVRG